MSIGFLSLSQEILWVRVFSFLAKGVSYSFSAVLFFFLVGIAIGSAIGKRFCEKHEDLVRTSAVVLAIAALVDGTLVFLVPELVGLVERTVGLFLVLLLVAFSALLKSIMFPIAHHLGSQQSGSRIGRSVSKVYFGNIIGSTLGPIVTGYVLLDYLTIDHCLLLIALGTGVLSLICALRTDTRILSITSATIILSVGTIAWPGSTSMIASMAEATERKEVIPGYKVEDVVQNRHGVIHTVSSTDGRPLAVLGGNMYDGRISVDMSSNRGRLDRVLVSLAAHPDPERVLFVGLATGSWVRILSASPRVKEIVVVEINLGYRELIAKYPQVSGLLTDPRVTIVFDDGRRWLRRNRSEKFDLIIQNTTYFWRAYSGNLLSRDYMQLVASHLRPKGIFALNSTSSIDVLETTRDVYPYVERRSSFVYGSASDFSKTIPSAEQALRELSLDGKLVFDEDAFSATGIARHILDLPFESKDPLWPHMAGRPEVITDQNLLVEHAHGKLREHVPGMFRYIDPLRDFLHQP